MSLLSWLSLQLLYSHLGINTGGSHSGLSCLERTGVWQSSRAGRAAAADGISGDGEEVPLCWARLVIPARGGFEAGLKGVKFGEEVLCGQVEAEVEEFRSGGGNLSRREGGHLIVLLPLLCRRERGHPFSPCPFIRLC